MKVLARVTFCALLTLPGCSLLPGTDGGGWPEIDAEYLTHHWVHSYEEDLHGSKIDVYRPGGYKNFPPSRFRMQYIFEEGGACRWYYLAPDDGHHFRSGTWGLVEDNILRVEKGEETVQYRVVELTEEVLRLRRLDSEEDTP